MAFFNHESQELVGSRWPPVRARKIRGYDASGITLGNRMPLIGPLSAVSFRRTPPRKEKSQGHELAVITASEACHHWCVERGGWKAARRIARRSGHRRLPERYLHLHLTQPVTHPKAGSGSSLQGTACVPAPTSIGPVSARVPPCTCIAQTATISTRRK
ncbi:hypothetical protein N7470_003463 [Penicillium chermesinum]|nr:hypothetical protein N7470_003463 [Penicillium chermesinum]